MAPLISVVVPVYNGAESIRAGLDSLLSQTMKDFEIIVVDDGSTDGTAEVVQAIEDPRIRLVRQRNQGAAAARNTAIQQSNGEFIAFQDHDDASAPDRFEKQITHLRTHTNIGILGSRSVIVDRNDRRIGGHNHPLEDAHLRFELMFDNPFVTSSIIAPRMVFSKLGLFDLNPNGFPEDYDLWSRVARSFKVANLPDRTVFYRKTNGSLSGTYALKEIAQIASENMAFVLGNSSPSNEMMDLALWYHKQYDLMSSRPDFSKMFKIIPEATKLLNDGLADDKLKAMAKTLERRLILERPAQQMSFSFRLRRRLMRRQEKLKKFFQSH